MNIKIQVNEHGNGCKVWLGGNAVLFPKLEEAKAYIAQLEERIEAASSSFSQKGNDPE